MNGDPLGPHLMDIVVRPELGGIVLAGGFGIRVKQSYLIEAEAETLISPFPLARATGDFDIFLRMEVFGDRERTQVIRNILENELHYKVRNYNWQFEKPLGSAFPGRRVKIDVHSRSPIAGEDVRVRRIRGRAMPSPPPMKVGEGGIDGRDTKEAFAIDVDPIRITIRGRTTAGDEREGEILVPHPYASLNMKVRAAHDWLKMERGEIERKPYAEKHPFDVYAITAMLLENEIARCQELVTEYEDHEIAIAIRKEAIELFAAPESPGSLQVREQTKGEFVFDKFQEGLQLALGL